MFMCTAESCSPLTHCEARASRRTIALRCAPFRAALRPPSGALCRACHRIAFIKAMVPSYWAVIPTSCQSCDAIITALAPLHDGLYLVTGDADGRVRAFSDQGVECSCDPPIGCGTMIQELHVVAEDTAGATMLAVGDDGLCRSIQLRFGGDRIATGMNLECTDPKCATSAKVRHQQRRARPPLTPSRPSSLWSASGPPLELASRTSLHIPSGMVPSAGMQANLRSPHGTWARPQRRCAPVGPFRSVPATSPLLLHSRTQRALWRSYRAESPMLLCQGQDRGPSLTPPPPTPRPAHTTPRWQAAGRDRRSHLGSHQRGRRHGVTASGPLAPDFPPDHHARRHSARGCFAI